MDTVSIEQIKADAKEQGNKADHTAANNNASAAGKAIEHPGLGEDGKYHDRKNSRLRDQDPCDFSL